MIITLPSNQKINLSKPIDISIPMDKNSATAWYVSSAEIKAVETDSFIGKVANGGSVNFNQINFNPHGNGTHTECVGHITPEFISINKTLKQFHFESLLITVKPQEYKGEESDWRKKGDLIITKENLEKEIANHSNITSLIIRTLPNNKEKLKKNWSDSNWAYLDEIAMKYLVTLGIKHLLIDLPSVDREFDGGKLLAHKSFWKYPIDTRFDCTITEMVYIPTKIKDGFYFLNLQIASFENDASPSKPLLFEYL